MTEKNIANQYFKQLKNNSKLKKINQITGVKYSLASKVEKGEIHRYFIDHYLEVGMCKLKSEKNYLFKYIEESDLIIIGFCLKGQKTIQYKGDQTIKQGDIIYFRPTEDFQIHLSDHSFLYYFIDNAFFQQSLKDRNCDDLFCDFHIDYLCKKGDISIKKAPDMIRAHIDEILTMKKIKINNFLVYAQVKGQLLHYLTWLVRFKLNENPQFDESNCERHYVAKAKKIILDHLEQPITITEIATRLDISIYKLQKYFKQLENTTVYDFMIQIKIDTSKMLLKQSSIPIIEIAQKVGYVNPSKFSTTFKRITGYTPTEYRKIG